MRSTGGDVRADDAVFIAGDSGAEDAEDTFGGFVVLSNGGADDASPAGEIKNDYMYAYSFETSAEHHIKQV